MNGVVVVDKPAGVTSAEVVRRIKRLVKPARVGHLGTLDPLATGVLPILIGESTKLAPFMEGGDKCYEGTIRLGTETDTLDREGLVVRTADLPALGPERLAKLECEFTGQIKQTPPVFSAIKRGGVPLYRLARRGVELEPPQPRDVQIHSLRLVTAAKGCLGFEVTCSTGTYIRALARDIGLALGSAAHLAELRRTRSGGFSIDKAAPFDQVLRAIEMQDKESIRIIAPADAVPLFPRARVDSVLERRLRDGDSSALDMLAPVGAEIFTVLNADGRLVAIAQTTSRVTAVIKRIFND
jgi:tRNA pseudouridine55 synthase